MRIGWSRREIQNEPNHNGEAAEGDELAFFVDGTAWRHTYVRYLERLGWRTTWAGGDGLKSLPTTCLVVIDGHVFALVNGAIWDTRVSPRKGRAIIATVEPPPTDTHAGASQ